MQTEHSFLQTTKSPDDGARQQEAFGPMVQVRLDDQESWTSPGETREKLFLVPNKNIFWKEWCMISFLSEPKKTIGNCVFPVKYFVHQKDYIMYICINLHWWFCSYAGEDKQVFVVSVIGGSRWEQERASLPPTTIAEQDAGEHVTAIIKTSPVNH